jgi:type VI secretion system protein ImpK
MSTPAQPLPARTNNLALAFQDVITVILRMRYRVQRVSDAAAFRLSIRKMIVSAVNDVRAMGYSDKTSEMALYAIIGFLDESVLNSQDPAFADWSRKPLQEEMFGSQLAGEYFFRNVDDLLIRPESPEVADALELHAQCLLLGYRGKYAFGNTGEIHSILARIRDKMARIRGPLYLTSVAAAPPVKVAAVSDKWVTRLAVAAVLIAALTLLAFAGFWAMLGSGIDRIEQSSVQPIRSTQMLLPPDAQSQETSL